MADMDQGIKRLLQTHPADVLALAVPGAEYLAMLPIDVATEPQLTLDTLLRARYQDVECAVDLEAEARPRPDISRRLFEYGARACIVTQLPVISVVLWLEPDGVAPTSPYGCASAIVLWLLGTSSASSSIACQRNPCSKAVFWVCSPWCPSPKAAPISPS